MLRRVKKASLTHLGTTYDRFISFAMITVAIPARAIWIIPFTLQLQGPFSAVVRAEFSPSYRSLAAGAALTRPLRSFLLLSWIGLYTKGKICQGTPIFAVVMMFVLDS